MTKAAKASNGAFADLEQALRTLTLEHLAKLAEYVPGPVKKQGTRKKLLAAYRNDHAADIPRINFPERWWSPGNLAQLVCLRKLLADYDARPHHHDLLKMAALGILVPVSNAKHNHVSLTFDKKPLPTVEVADVLARQLRDMSKDLHAVSHLPAADVTIYHGNSKELSKVLPADRKVSAVITSPPYPNRISYACETRPQLFYFDFVQTARAVGQLETDAIGGTSGKATSVLARGVAPKNKLIGCLLEPNLRGIPTNGSLMARCNTRLPRSCFAFV
jgi:hypothetical protein